MRSPSTPSTCGLDREALCLQTAAHEVDDPGLILDQQHPRALGLLHVGSGASGWGMWHALPT